MSTYANTNRRAALMPRVIGCPLHMDGLSHLIDHGQGGARYRCASCGLEFKVPLAQSERLRIKAHLDRWKSGHPD